MPRAEGREADWLMTLLGAMWLGLFPLWQDGSYTRITRAKWLGMLGFSAVTAVAVLTAVIILLIWRQGRKLRFHPIQGVAVAYLLWVALSARFGSFANSVNDSGQLTVLMGAKRYEGLVAQSVYVGLFLLMSLYPVKLRAVMNAAAVGMLIYGAITALQYAGHNPFDLFPANLSLRTNYEFQGTIGNIDMVSGYLCLVVPTLLLSFAMGKTGILCLAAGIVGVLMQLLMQVQSGLIAMAAGLGALAALMLTRPEIRARGGLVLACALTMVSLRLLIALPWHEGTEEVLFPYAVSAWKIAPLLLAAVVLFVSFRIRRVVPGRWVLLLFALVAAAGLAAILLGTFPEGSAPWELGEVLRGRGQDAFGKERLGIWRMTLEMARKNPLFGTGPDTFWYAMAQHQADTAQSLVQRFDNPHNMLLAVLSGSGVPALILYLALMGVAAIRCLRGFREDPWLLALLIGLAAYQAQGMFTFSVCLVSPMFWVTLGMTMARREEDHDAHEFGAAPTGG